MKKLILSILTALTVFSVSAQSSSTVKEVVEVLNAVEGYVFLTQGEYRDLKTIFNRTEAVFGDADISDLKAMHYTVSNSEVVTLKNDEGEIFGNKFGKSLLTITETSGQEHYYIVFVCPTISVVTPEGVVYSHQKIYGDKAKVEISQSNEFVVNCVMHDGVDVTDLFRENLTDGDKGRDGFYESETPIEGNSTIIVSLESGKENSDGHVVGIAPINLQMIDGGMTLRIVDTETLEPALAGEFYEITNLEGSVIQEGEVPGDSEIQFSSENKGIAFVKFPNREDYGTFKIVIYDSRNK